MVPCSGVTTRVSRVRALVGLALVGLVAAVLALGIAAPAFGASLPEVIAFTDQGGIWTVRPGNVGSEQGFYSGGFNPAWSPNGEALAFLTFFQTSAGQGKKIVVTDRSGKVIATPLTSPFSLNESIGGPLAWSPDGRRIAYICYHWTGQIDDVGRYFYVYDMCVVDVATGAHRVLATHTDQLGITHHNDLSTGCDCTMSWSPNGDEIAVDVVTTSPAQNEIGIVDVATGALTQLTDTGAFNPAFSPNGHEIAYITQDRRLSIMSASGGHIRHILPPPGGTYIVGTPAWSPDGKDLVYAWSAPPANNLNQDLFSVSVHGGHRTQLTDTPYYSQDPSWAQSVTLCTVPKLKGSTLAAAKKLLRLAGCVLGSVGGPSSNRGKRHVVKQSPGPNRNVPVGTKVNVKVA
jgi:WD40 repeat protein